MNVLIDLNVELDVILGASALAGRLQRGLGRLPSDVNGRLDAIVTRNPKDFAGSAVSASRWARLPGNASKSSEASSRTSATTSTPPRWTRQAARLPNSRDKVADYPNPDLAIEAKSLRYNRLRIESFGTSWSQFTSD